MEKLPEMKHIASSNIKEIGYKKKERELFIKFDNGRTYKYSPFLESQFKDFLNAKSKGSFFFKRIRTNKLLKYKEL